MKTKLRGQTWKISFPTIWMDYTIYIKIKTPNYMKVKPDRSCFKEDHSDNDNETRLVKMFQGRL